LSGISSGGKLKYKCPDREIDVDVPADEWVCTRYTEKNGNQMESVHVLYISLHTMIFGTNKW